MPLVYDFSFANEFGGLDATVTDATGAEVDGSPLTLNSTGDGSLELDEGTYTATVSNTALALGNAKSVGVLNVAASIAAGGGGVGASETAYFVATGPVYATDAAGTDTLNFVADDRHGELPDWVTLVSGDIVLSNDAGTTAFAVAAVCDMDFSEASAVADAPGIIANGVILANLDATEVLNIFDDGIVGDGEDLQTTDPLRGGGLLTTAGTLTVALQPVAKDDTDTTIPDGVATPRVALTVTRIAQAAVIPD